MSAFSKNIKLNPTTITIPQTPLSSSSYPLKLSFTPDLLLQDSLSSLPPTLKKDSDAIFEVMVPVGGNIEVEIEIDRDGLGRLGGVEMSISQEIELEEMIKHKIISAFRMNSTALAMKGIKTDKDSSYKIQPLASNADRAASYSAIVPENQPVAHLGKISLFLNWCSPSTKEVEKQDSDESQSSISDSLSPSQPVSGGSGVHSQVVVKEECTDGQLPTWAAKQLEQALDQLFRTNLIKRFPLIFDPDLHRYIPSITKSANLLHSLTRVLALSGSHRTELFNDGRPILRLLIREQGRMTKFKAEQISSLCRRNRSKRLKSDIVGEITQEDPQSQSDIPTDSQGLHQKSTQAKEIHIKLLSDAITRMGWVEWKQRRARGGKLSYRKIKLSLDSDLSNDRLPSSQGSELNNKMAELHLDEGGRWDAFLDDDHDHPESEVHHMPKCDEDELFVASEAEDDYEDEGDLFSDHEEDEFLDSDDESDENRERMAGGCVVGYPWLDHERAFLGDNEMEGQDDIDDSHYDDIFDFDCNIHDLYLQDRPMSTLDQDPIHSLGDIMLEDDDLFGENEDQISSQPTQVQEDHYQSYHPIDLNSGECAFAPSLLLDAGHAEFPTERLSIPDSDEFLDDDDLLGDDILDHEEQLCPPSPDHGTFRFPEDNEPENIDEHLDGDHHLSTASSAAHETHHDPIELEPAAYMLPRSPQFSLGQAGAILCDPDLFESDDELESEWGVYTADQYFDEPELESPTPSSSDGCLPEEEIVYGIPLLPDIDMRHYGEEDEFMSDEDDPIVGGLDSRAGTGLKPTIVYMDFDDLDQYGTRDADRFIPGTPAPRTGDTELSDPASRPGERLLGTLSEEMGEYSDDDLF